MTEPSVTAIVPTRGRPRELIRALASIFAQRYGGELDAIVVFDQEEPAAPAIDVPDGRSLRVTGNSRTPGLAGARNTGALQATGDLLAFLDDDDEWLPGKLERQVAALRDRPDASAATCGIVVANGRREIRRVPPGRLVTFDDLTRSRRMEVHSSTLLMRRDRFLGDIGMVDEGIPGSYGEDYDWILRAAATGPIVAIEEALARIHWSGSFFADRWATIVPALHYQLEKHPELARDRRNLARMYGRLAFAHAALGERDDARRWARRSVRLDHRQPRGYLAYLVSAGVVPARMVQRAATAVGKGV